MPESFSLTPQEQSEPQKEVLSGINKAEYPMPRGPVWDAICRRLAEDNEDYLKMVNDSHPLNTLPPGYTWLTLYKAFGSKVASLGIRDSPRTFFRVSNQEYGFDMAYMRKMVLDEALTAIPSDGVLFQIRDAVLASRSFGHHMDEAIEWVNARFDEGWGR